MDATVWLYWLGGQALGGAGVAVVLWALLGDRLLKGHTKRRCPKCWHDLSATPGLTCPECGKTARSEARLFRSRKRRRLAAAGVVGVVLGTGVNSWPWMEAGGWSRFVPLPVQAACWQSLPPSALQWFVFRIGGNARIGPLTGRALEWSTNRSLRRADSAQHPAALSMLATARVKTPLADERAREAVLRSIRAAGGPAQGSRVDALAYLLATMSPSERVALAEEIAATDPSQSSASSVAALLGSAVRRDPSLAPAALRVLLRPGREALGASFSISSTTPGGEEVWWNTCLPVLLTISAEPETDPQSLEYLLRRGEWERVIEQEKSVEPLRVMAERTASTPGNGPFPWTDLLGDVDLPGVTDVVIDAARRAEPEARVQLLRVVHSRLWYDRDIGNQGRAKLSEQAVATLHEWLTGEDGRLRSEVVNVLDAAGNDLTQELTALLDHPRVEVRRSALYLLGRRRPYSAEIYARLESVVQDDSQPTEVRVAAWNALQGVPRPKELPEATKPSPFP